MKTLRPRREHGTTAIHQQAEDLARQLDELGRDDLAHDLRRHARLQPAETLACIMQPAQAIASRMAEEVSS